MSDSRKLPKYRHQKSRGLAVVRLNGKDHYLGKYGTVESRQAYDRLIAHWLASNRQIIEPIEATAVVELIVAYWPFA
jgi:hypothetical protein